MNFYDPVKLPKDSLVHDSWYNDTVCPMGSRKYTSQYVKLLPSPETIYYMLLKRGCNGEEIIDAMLRLYHRYRNFKVDYLAESELTLGFIGYRGTGKSASIAKVVGEDFLLAGKRAWSNMPINIKVVYKDAAKTFSTQELPKLKLLQGDEQFKNGVVVLDEVNMEVAEASRFMSNTNLEFTNQIQQIRKKGLDVIWSAQNWNSIDARLRWQSDFIVLCSCDRPENRGIISHWRVMDSTGLSGKLDFETELRSHYLMDKIVNQGNAYIRPWWFAYETKKLQGQSAYNRKELEKQDEDNIGDVSLADTTLSKAYLNDAIKYIRDGVFEVIKKEYYKLKGIEEDHSKQISAGRAFKAAGWKPVNNQGKWRREVDSDLVMA